MQHYQDVEQLVAALNALADSFGELTELGYLQMADIYTTLNIQSK